MTLLEALVALVILGSSAVGFLGVFQGGARLVQSADDWHRAASAAESAVEESVRAHLEGTAPEVPPSNRNDGLETRVDVRPFQDRLDEVVVLVTLPDGRVLAVHRLVRQR